MVNLLALLRLKSLLDRKYACFEFKSTNAYLCTCKIWDSSTLTELFSDIFFLMESGFIYLI